MTSHRRIWALLAAFLLQDSGVGGGSRSWVTGRLGHIVRLRGAGTGWAMLGQATKMGWNGKWATMVFDCLALFISFSFSISSSSVFEKKSFGSIQNA
jgi:hypothetical protein